MSCHVAYFMPTLAGGFAKAWENVEWYDLICSSVIDGLLVFLC